MVGALTVAEKFVWSMIFIIFALIVAFAILGYAENAGGDNILGRFATWVNEHARPQAN